MRDIKGLLDIRRKLKAKKPDFIRQDAHKKTRLGRKWKKPKGIQSKMRLKLKGYRKVVSKGYMGPKSSRNLHKSGLAVRIINTIRDIENIRKEKEGALIAKNVGQKRRVEILKKAKELGINVLNIKDIDVYLKNIEKAMAEKKKTAEKEKKAAKEEKEAKKEDKLSEKLQSEEEKKEAEKKEKDKILTKRS